MIKVASISAWFLGLGFGLPCLYGIWHLWRGKGIAYFIGFPTYGHGPFEKWGVHTSMPLLLGFLLVCMIECVVGQMLWSAGKGGAILSLVLIPVEMLFYIGFALPVGPPFVLLRTVLVLLSWSALNKGLG